MSRDGMVEVNALSGESKRVSQRGQDFNLSGPSPEEQSHRAFATSEARGKRQRRMNRPNEVEAQETLEQNHSLDHEMLEQNDSYPSLHDMTEEPLSHQGSSFSLTNRYQHDLRQDAPLQKMAKKKRSVRIRRDFGAQADSIYGRQSKVNAPISTDDLSTKSSSHNGVHTEQTRSPTFHEKEPALQIEKEPALQVEKNLV